MNAARILEELQLERKLVAQRAAELDDAIAVFARLANGTRTAAAPVETAPARRPKGAGVDWARARQQYENAGVAVSRLATTFKVSQAAVYARLKAEGWKRRAEDGE